MNRTLFRSLCTAPVLSLALLGDGADAPLLVWGDFDGDGLADLAALRSDGPVRILRNAGDGSLVDVTDASGVTEFGARAGSWQDVDGDGYQDLLLVRPGGHCALYRGLGRGQFEDATQVSGLDVATPCSQARWIDYDQDGHADLELWTPSGVRLLHNDGTGFLQPTDLAWAAPAAPARELPTSGGLRVPDLDSEGTQAKLPAAGDPGELGGSEDRAPTPSQTSTVGRQALGAVGGVSATRHGGGIVSGTATGYCAAGLEDDGLSGHCIQASTLPTLNMLYPLGSEFFVDTDGDVGFGTTNPRSHVHLRGEGLDATLRLSTSNPNGTSKLLLLENNNPEANLVGAALTYDGVLDQVRFGTLTAGAEKSRLVIERTTGDVGINTTNPVADLHVVGDATLGSVLIAPNSASSGQSSELMLAEDDNGVHGMKLHYDGAGNLLRFQGITSGSVATHVTLARDTGLLDVGGDTGSGRVAVTGSLSGVGNASLRAVNSNAGGGNAGYLESAGTGTTAIFKQLGSGAILKGETAAGTLFTVSNTGRVVTTALQITGGGDLVEGFDGSEELEPGSVVALDPERPGHLVATRQSYERRVAGVVSGAGGVNHGIRMGQDDVLDGEHLLAMAGRVYVRCTDENGPIEPGDLLTSSSSVGCAMRATDERRAFGAVIGKAVSRLDADTGLVLVLVNLQ